MGERGWGAILKKPWEDEVVVAHTFNCCTGRWGAQRPADCLTPQEVRVTTVLPTRSLVGMGEGFRELWNDRELIHRCGLHLVHSPWTARCWPSERLCFRSLLTCMLKLLRDASRHSRD